MDEVLAGPIQPEWLSTSEVLVGGGALMFISGAMMMFSLHRSKTIKEMYWRFTFGFVLLVVGAVVGAIGLGIGLPDLV